MLKQLKKRTEGFTIIEVLIVLAIAGLILLIVFLAVPALQRNSRNTQRRNDVAKSLAAVQEYTNNNNGTVPASGVFNTVFSAAAVNFAIYSSASVSWVHSTSPTLTADPADVSVLKVADYMTCNAAGTGGTTTGASARSLAAVFDIESASGSPTAQCVAS